MSLESLISKKRNKTSIRLLAKRVRLIAHLEEGEKFPECGYCFCGVGSDHRIYDLPRSIILNGEEVDEKILEDPTQLFQIVVPEALVWQMCMDGITFSRDIELPKVGD